MPMPVIRTVQPAGVQDQVSIVVFAIRSMLRVLPSMCVASKGRTGIAVAFCVMVVLIRIAKRIIKRTRQEVQAFGNHAPNAAIEDQL